MKTINWHLGLGDAIICAPIAMKYLYQNGGYVMSLSENFLSVDSFFANSPIGVHIVKDAYPVKEALDLGHYGEKRLEGESFDRWFYRQAGMPIEDRTYCPITNGVYKRTEQLPVPKEDFIFVHTDGKRGYNVDGQRIEGNLFQYFPTRTDKSILAYADILIEAKEIHVIDSCFLHLADRLPTKGKLFWHRYARANEDTKGLYLKQNWTIYETD